VAKTEDDVTRDAGGCGAGAGQNIRERSDHSYGVAGAGCSLRLPPLDSGSRRGLELARVGRVIKMEMNLRATVWPVHAQAGWIF
jgi:hypothetical protein